MFKDVLSLVPYRSFPAWLGFLSLSVVNLYRGIPVQNSSILTLDPQTGLCLRWLESSCSRPGRISTPVAGPLGLSEKGVTYIQSTCPQGSLYPTIPESGLQSSPKAEVFGAVPFGLSGIIYWKIIYPETPYTPQKK